MIMRIPALLSDDFFLTRFFVWFLIMNRKDKLETWNELSRLSHLSGEFSFISIIFFCMPHTLPLEICRQRNSSDPNSGHFRIFSYSSASLCRVSASSNMFLSTLMCCYVLSFPSTARGYIHVSHNSCVIWRKSWDRRDRNYVWWLFLRFDVLLTEVRIWDELNMCCVD